MTKLSKMTPLEQQRANSLVKILWVVEIGEYNRLRLIKGCENLQDIPASADLK